MALSLIHIYQVFVGVGSDDVIAMSFLTFFNSQKKVRFPDITYSFYKVWADLYRIPYETPALDENMAIRPLDYKRENGGIIFPNPNAPTGLYMPLDQVEEIVKANQDVIVIVDEAYICLLYTSQVSGHGRIQDCIQRHDWMGGYRRGRVHIPDSPHQEVPGSS